MSSTEASTAEPEATNMVHSTTVTASDSSTNTFLYVGIAAGAVIVTLLVVLMRYVQKKCRRLRLRLRENTLPCILMSCDSSTMPCAERPLSRFTYADLQPSQGLVGSSGDLGFDECNAMHPPRMPRPRRWETINETSFDGGPTLDIFNDLHGQQSSVIRLDKHQIEIRIPSSEKLTERDVHVRAITQVPPELASMLKERQAIICVGLEISSTATFSNPVKVTLPHSAIFTDPDDASIGTYYRKTSDDNFSFKSVANGNLRCHVRERDLDLYLDHFSEWWIIAFITSIFFGKRLICTPHVPISTRMYDEHLMVLCIRDDNAGKEEVEPGYNAPVKGEGFSLGWFAGPLNVTCKADTKDVGCKKVEARVFRQYIEKNIQFIVKTAGITKSQIFVEFTLEQATEMTEIVCPVILSGSDQTSPDTLVSGATGSSVSTAAGNPPGATSICGEAVSDDILNTLAEHVPPASYNGLSEKLGIEYNTAVSLLAEKGYNYTSAIRQCLGKWKDRTGGSLVELRQILTRSELKGLEQYVK